MHLAAVLLLSAIFAQVIHPSVEARSRIKRKTTQKCYDNLCTSSGGTYPTNLIRKLLSKNEEAFESLLGSVLQPKAPSKQLMLKSVPSVVEENLCSSTPRTIFPKYDKEYNVSIVNVPGFYQSVAFEVCGKSRKCAEAVVLDYETTCKQLYNQVRLLYLDEKNELKFRLFTVPNVCVCVYSKKRYFYEKEG